MRNIAFCAAVSVFLIACGDGTGPDTTRLLQPTMPTSIEGVVGTAVPQPPAVRLLTGAGTPISGELITFLADARYGGVTGTTVHTDAAGLASIPWTLHERAGVQYLRASADGVPSVVFTATAAPGPVSEAVRVGPGHITLPVGTAARLAIRVTDAFGNAIKGVPIHFQVASGGGLFTQTPALTDTSGVAVTDWRLGLADGQAAVAVVEGLPAVHFTASAVPGPWRFDLRPDPSWMLNDSALELGVNGQFSMRIGAITGIGSYALAGDMVHFTYTDGFWPKIIAAYNWWPFGPDQTTEVGTLVEGRLTISRCATDECYRRDWIYELK